MNKNPGYIKVKKVSWIRRNPRRFVITCTSLCVLTLFSKPIYDLFFSNAPVPDLNEELKTYKSRFRRN